MKAILINHNEEYAVREIINSYFPKLKIEFGAVLDSKEDYIISKLTTKNEQYTYECECSLSGRKHSTTLQYNGYSKNKIKKSISDCLNKITDIKLPWGLLTGIRPAKMVREFLKTNTGSIKDAVDFLINEYETNVQKSNLAVTVEENEKKHIDSMISNGISLYIGIPFCPTRCLYCSFTSQSVSFSNKLTNEYTDCLIKEITEISKHNYIKNHIIESVYFGGGTPTALEANQIELILKALFENFDLSQIKEFTFEAGRPDTIDKDKLELLKKFGISRISINPQTSKDDTLKIIGRNHTYKDFENAYKLARSMGFTHINCDIIAGLPDEDLSDFKTTLTTLLNLNPESITVHTMCIKHGSYLDMKYDMYSMATSKTVNSMLDYAHTTLAEAGLIPYYLYRQKNMLGNLENVGYCIPGHECIYNIYIMEEVQSILALGGGASTKIVTCDNIERSFNVKEVSEYINRIDEMIERKMKFLDNF